MKTTDNKATDNKATDNKVKQPLVVNSAKMIIINFIIFVLAIIFDQLTKVWIEPLKTRESIKIIDKVLYITYLENRGAAFGMLQGQRVFFMIIAVVVFAVIGFIIAKIPAQKKYIKLNILLTFILAGAVGNTIDRVMLSYVRDFIYFKIIDFPVFNVADIYITCATALLMIVILFVYKDEDLSFMRSNKADAKMDTKTEFNSDSNSNLDSDSEE